MPKYRVIVEGRFDIEAANEDAAKVEAIKKVDPDDCIAWETEEAHRGDD